MAAIAPAGLAGTDLDHPRGRLALPLGDRVRMNLVPGRKLRQRRLIGQGPSSINDWTVLTMIVIALLRRSLTLLQFSQVINLLTRFIKINLS